MRAIDAAAARSDFDEVEKVVREGASGLDDPRLAGLVPRVAGTVSIDTSPAASVRVRRLSLDPAGRSNPVPPDIPLGPTPVKEARLIAGDYAIELSAEGIPALRTTATVEPGKQLRLSWQLAAPPSGRGDMVFIPAGEVTYRRETRRVPAFFIDQHEVTNAEYQRFVIEGGYRNEQLWPDELIVAGKRVPRATALAAFVDRTGLPGPSTWTNGRFVDGKSEHPVVGISWYEASAYAQWTKKELPTFEQWWRAAVAGQSTGFPWGASARSAEARANFGLADTTPVNRFAAGTSLFGAADMAGNAREWLREVGRESLHPAAGASWLEPAYDFERVEWFDAATRYPGLGFRLAVPAAADTAAPELASILASPEMRARAIDDP